MVASSQKRWSLPTLLHCMAVLLVVCTLSSTYAFAQQNNIERARFYESGDLSRLVIDLNQETKYSFFTLNKPNRVVVDLLNVNPNFDLSTVALSGDRITKVRYSKPKSKNDIRIVIETSKTLTVSTEPLAPLATGNPTAQHRLLINMTDAGYRGAPPALSKKPEPQSVQAKPRATKPAPSSNIDSKFRVRDTIKPSNQAGSKVSSSSSNTTVSSSAPNRDNDIIVVIDAGHGGVDPGSIGPGGTYEKNITLSISKMLASEINAEPGMRAVLTREGDYYISPNDRPKIAVKENADLLVSIHADAFTTAQPRGGSVWVLSKGRADSELGRLLEQTERSSELLGPAADVIEDRDTERYFAETILNMSMDLFRALSYELSHEIIKDMKGVTKLHKKVPQSASLAVLTAPETPSILVEVGFISNPQEEKNLNWAKHRRRLAESLSSSIKRYFKKTPPDGTTWASLKNDEPIKHKVVRNESLSVIAQRYGVTVRALKAHNGLSSDLVRIGQVLKIPR
jgi:N-acetylmuramoyl-L-alanine amidase